MSETARKLFEGLSSAKDAIVAIAPGLKNLGADVKAELFRLGTQGSMESANLLNNGHAFVPYGPGQYTPSPEYATEPDHAAAPEHEQASHEMERDR